MWWARAKRRVGFTLVELLTVAGIICAMVALVTTAILSAQESGRLASCRNNLAQVHRLVLQYRATYGGYMPAWWHERWVGELGLVGKAWGGLRDDLNPNIPVVWGNFSEMATWIKDSTSIPQIDPVTGAPVYSNGKQVFTTINRNYLIRTPSPTIVCKSDSVQYRSDQGCVVSYLGLAKYGWWCPGGGGGQIFWNPVADATQPNGVKWVPGGENFGNCYGPYNKDGSPTGSHFEYHQMTEFDDTSRRILLCETDPSTWQYEPGSCGCRWYTYTHPQDLQKRHYDGSNILFQDGHVEFVREAQKMKIVYWEPDYAYVSPEY